MGAIRRNFSRLSQRRVSLLQQTQKAQSKAEKDEREASKRKRKNIDVRCQIWTGRLITLSVSPDDSMIDVSEKIRIKEGINPEQQNLLFNGLKLEMGATVDDYNIQEHATLFLTLRNVGG